jgi:hypothetical protein
MTKNDDDDYNNNNIRQIICNKFNARSVPHLTLLEAYQIIIGKILFWFISGEYRAWGCGLNACGSEQSQLKALRTR